jgi:uncharacterized protein (DUF302 family)
MMQALMPARSMMTLFTYKVVSKQSIETLVENLPAVVEQHNFSLVHTYVYHEMLEKRGHPIRRKVYLYELCQSKMAASMLTAYPQFSIFMPCKLAVYEENNQVVMATMNMQPMLKALKKTPELYQEATNMFGSLVRLIDSFSNKPL